MKIIKEIKKLFTTKFKNNNKNNVNNNSNKTPIIQSTPVDKIIIQNNENYEIINNSSNFKSSINNNSPSSLNSSKIINSSGNGSGNGSGGNNNIYSDIQDIDWNNLIGIKLINNSMILATIYNGGEFNNILIKSSNTMAQDLYASVLQVILKLPVPEMRLIDSFDDEFQKMTENLFRISKEQNEEPILNFIENELKKSFFLIMEYRSGGKLFNELNHKDYFSSYKKGEKKLTQLGKLMSFDLICNINKNKICNNNNNNSKNNNNNNEIENWNELTFFSNLIFYEEPDLNGWYFSITHSTMSFLNNSFFTTGHRKQIDNLKSLLYSIFQNPTSESIPIYKMRKHLSNNLNVHIPSPSTSSYHWSTHIQFGIAKGVSSIVENLNYQVLLETKEIVKKMVSQYTNENNIIWNKGIDSIYPPFLLDVLKEIMIEKNSNYFKKINFKK